MENIVPHNFEVGKDERNKLNGHNSLVIWLTGLSGSGKSTIANLLEFQLYKKKIRTFSLDGDNVRKGLNKNLGFSEEDRHENLRRVAEVARLLMDAGLVVIASFITPLKKDREMIAKIIGQDNYFEIFVNTSLVECERRDVKGLYKKARAGEIKSFTGISAPYEDPVDHDLEIRTEEENIEEAVNKILLNLQNRIKILNE